MRSSGGALAKALVIGSKLIERDIFGTDEAELLQIGVGEPPTASLVNPGAMGQHPGQRALGLDLADALDLGVEHPFLPPFAVGGCESQSAPDRRRPNSSSASPSGPAARTAASVAARSRDTNRKSLKWPACSAASWRLSVKASSLRCIRRQASGCAFIQRSALDTSSVVAELRPSADRLATLLILARLTAG